MPPFMALQQTRRKLQPHRVGVEATKDNRYRLYSLDHRPISDRFTACPEMAYIAGLRMAKACASA